MEIFNFPPYISSIFRRKKRGPISAVIFKYNSITDHFTSINSICHKMAILIYHNTRGGSYTSLHDGSKMMTYVYNTLYTV